MPGESARAPLPAVFASAGAAASVPAAATVPAAIEFFRNFLR